MHVEELTEESPTIGSFSQSVLVSQPEEGDCVSNVLMSFKACMLLTNSDDEALKCP